MSSSEIMEKKTNGKKSLICIHFNFIVIYESFCLFFYFPSSPQIAAFNKIALHVSLNLFHTTSFKTVIIILIYPHSRIIDMMDIRRAIIIATIITLFFDSLRTFDDSTHKCVKWNTKCTGQGWLLCFHSIQNKQSILSHVCDHFFHFSLWYKSLLVWFFFCIFRAVRTFSPYSYFFHLSYPGW